MTEHNRYPSERFYYYKYSCRTNQNHHMTLNAHVFVPHYWPFHLGMYAARQTNVLFLLSQVCSSALSASNGGHAGGCSDSHSVLHHDLLLRRLPAFGARARWGIPTAGAHTQTHTTSINFTYLAVQTQTQQPRADRSWLCPTPVKLDGDTCLCPVFSTLYSLCPSCSARMGNITPWQRPSSTLLRGAFVISSTTSQVKLLTRCSAFLKWFGGDFTNFSLFHERILQPIDAGFVHSDIFLPGVLDLRPGGVRGSLHPIPAHRSSLGEAVWNTAVLHHPHWLGVCVCAFWNNAIIKWIIVGHIHSSRCSNWLLFCLL